MTVQEVLDLEPASHEKFHQLSLEYSELQGSPELREFAAGLYDNITAEEVLIHAGQEGIFLFMFAAFEKGDHINRASPHLSITMFTCAGSLL